MNVLIVTEPGVDGVFRYVESLCDFLIGRDVSVHLAFSDRRGCDRLPRLVERIRAAGGRTLNLGVANRPEFGDLPAFLALRRLAAAAHPDVIHSHSSKAGALARALAFCGIPAVQVYQPHAYVGMRPVRGRIDVVYDAIESLLGRVSRTLTCSMGEKAFALGRLGLPPDRVHLVTHGVDTRRFAPASSAEKRSLRFALGLPESAPVLGFMGRSSAQKDPLTLYRAFALAAAQRRDLVLFHVGHGEFDSEIEGFVRDQGLSDRVRRLDYLPFPAEFYRAVDGFILTSRYEGFSLAALEALAAGLPMILSDAPGNSDMLSLPLSHAWKASPGDVEAFARAIVEWADDLVHPRPSNHRLLARTRFQHNRQLERVLDLYRDWVAGKHPEYPPSAPDHSVHPKVI